MTETGFPILDALRAQGWTVGVHNDYRLQGKAKTFWLLTHVASGRFVKGEGDTDAEALARCAELIWPSSRCPWYDDDIGLQCRHEYGHTGPHETGDDHIPDVGKMVLPSEDAREHGAPWGAMPPQALTEGHEASDALRERANRLREEIEGDLRRYDWRYMPATVGPAIAAALAETAEEARKAEREACRHLVKVFWFDYPMAHSEDAAALEDFCDVIADAIAARGGDR